MKKFLGLLSCILFFSSCDDGNTTTTGITFDPTKPVLSCTTNNNGLYYKINGPEALILQTPASSFPNDTTNQPRIVLIGNTTNTNVVLRSFNATVTDSYFCSVIPPSTPMVTEEWDASPGVAGPTGVPQSGYLEITTTAIKDTTAITGYNHNIIFKNITFANSKSSFIYDNYHYGIYTTKP